MLFDINKKLFRLHAIGIFAKFSTPSLIQRLAVSIAAVFGAARGTIVDQRG